MSTLSMPNTMTPSDIAQKQLDAYNAHDIVSFLRCYHEDVVVSELPSGKQQYVGKQTMQSRYEPLFAQKRVHARLVSRMAIGNMVIDEENVTGLGDGDTKSDNVHAIAMYEVTEDLITKIWFMRA